MQLFLYHSIKNFLRINELFNGVFKIRGKLIIIGRRISIRISIATRKITITWPSIEISPISIVIEIISEDKIHINGIIIMHNQSRQRHVIISRHSDETSKVTSKLASITSKQVN